MRICFAISICFERWSPCNGKSKYNNIDDSKNNFQFVALLTCTRAAWFGLPNKLWLFLRAQLLVVSAVVNRNIEKICICKHVYLLHIYICIHSEMCKWLVVIFNSSACVDQIRKMFSSKNKITVNNNVPRTDTPWRFSAAFFYKIHQRILFAAVDRFSRCHTFI